MTTKTLKNTALVMLFSIASVLLFAASGGKGKKATKSKALTSTKYSIGKISLRSGYEFKGNKLMLLTPKKDYTSLQNYTSIQKGNKTMIVASKHILNKPSTVAPSKAARISVSLIKMPLQ